MTLAAQLDEEEPCMLLRQRVLRNTDGLAIPLNELVPVRQVQGRVDDMSARQMESWGTLGIAVDWVFLTLDQQIINGDVVQVPPSQFFPQRYLRIVGKGSVFRTKGAIDDHVEYPCRETLVT